jgi:glutamate synthase (ferredoxin)
MSSEIGVLDIKPEDIHRTLEPGKCFGWHERSRIIEDDEIKNAINQRPYKQWLDENLLSLSQIPYTVIFRLKMLILKTRQRLFGYTIEDLKQSSTRWVPRAEALSSMKWYSACRLSDQPQLLYNYFKQLFAQVTNPPLDGIREEIITDI